MKNLKFRVWDGESLRQSDQLTYIGLEKRTPAYQTFCQMSTILASTMANKREEFSTVELFTGLQDSKGQDIYEGDIIKQGEQIDTVEYSEESAGFIPFRNWDEYERGGENWDASKCKIIGNVHENGGLIESRD